MTSLRMTATTTLRNGFRGRKMGVLSVDFSGTNTYSGGWHRD